MLLFDKKKIANTVVGKLKESNPDDFVQKIGEEAVIAREVPVEGEEDLSMALEAAAEEFADAVEKKDPKQIVETLKALMELCEMDEEEAEEEDESEEEQE